MGPSIATRIVLGSQILRASTEVLRRAVWTTAALAETAAKRLQSGPVLRTRSGFLSARTTAQVEEHGDTFVLRLGNPQRYSRILELGGVTPPHAIRPRRPDGVLAFERSGATIFARRVQHPGSHIPARPTLRPALEEAAAQLPARVLREAAS
jgi:hypothetical protein